jgi:hypothetical protein
VEERIAEEEIGAYTLKVTCFFFSSSFLLTKKRVFWELVRAEWFELES